MSGSTGGPCHHSKFVATILKIFYLLRQRARLSLHCCGSVALVGPSLLNVPTDSPSRRGDVAVYVLDINKPSLPTPFTCPCVCFCRYSPFNCISFHQFSRKLSAFSLCSSGLTSASLVLSTTHLFMKVSLSPQCSTGLTAPTN